VARFGQYFQCFNALFASRSCYRGQDMLFCKSMAAAWLVVACLAANAAIDTTNPSIIYAPVQYPSSAVSSRQEGTVLVMTEVDASGRTVGAKVEKSSGYLDLDAAALQSISEWTFRPGMKQGKPTAQWIRVPVRFQLQHETTDISAMTGTLSAVAGFVLGTLGSLVWLAGFVWSIVLAKRQSILWLSGMVALWIVTYPLFVAMHWSSARRNLLVVLLGIVLLCLGAYFAPSQRLSISHFGRSDVR
jgi:TonB family protein